MWDEEDEDCYFLSASMIEIINIDTNAESTLLILSLDDEGWIEASFSDHPVVYNAMNDEYDFFEGFIELYEWQKLGGNYDC